MSVKQWLNRGMTAIERTARSMHSVIAPLVAALVFLTAAPVDAQSPAAVTRCDTITVVTDTTASSDSA